MCWLTRHMCRSVICTLISQTFASFFTLLTKDANKINSHININTCAYTTISKLAYRDTCTPTHTGETRNKKISINNNYNQKAKYQLTD